MATEVASAYVSLSANTAALTTGLAQAEAKVRGFAAGADAAAGRASKSFAAMGVAIKRGLLVGGLAAAAGLTSAVKTAADFESELSALRSVTRASAGDMDRLKEAALDLGAETKFSALEVAQAQTELARAGMSTADILGGSLRGSLALAAAGQMELADASATIVNTMGQFGLGVADATHIADALAEAANATTADVGEMAQALENVGNIARNAGLSFDDVVVGLELLAENGTKGAEAGSALRSMLTNIATPSAKAAKLMNELGLEFYDAQGNFKDFGEISSMLQRSFAGLTAEQKQNAAAVIAGTYGQKALLAILQASPQAIAQYERGLQRQGQAAEMAATMNDNLQGKLEQLGGAIETIKIRVGSALIPILSEAAVATAEWLEALGDSGGLKNFASGLADGFQSFASAARDAWNAVSPLVMQLGGIAVSAFNALRGAITGAYPVLLNTGRALATIAGAVLAVVGPIMEFVAAVANVPGVAQAATAAIVGLAAGMVAFKAATAGMAAAGAISSFVSLAASVRSLGDASALAATAFPRFAPLLGALASPAGIAAAAIAGVTAVTLTLSSGLFAGASVTERMASALNSVAQAAQTAQAALNGFKGSVTSLKDATLQEEAAKLRVEAAWKRVNQLAAEGQKGTLEYRQAVNLARQEELAYNQARAKSADAAQKVRREAMSAVGSYAKLAGAIDDKTASVQQEIAAVKRLPAALGLPQAVGEKLVGTYEKLQKSGASASEKFDLIRATARKAADALEKAGKPQAAAELQKIGNLDNSGLIAFGQALADLETKGVKGPRAIQQALKSIKPPKNVRLNAKDDITPKASKAKRSLDSIRPKPPVPLSANDQISPKIPGIQAQINSLRGRTVTVDVVYKPHHPPGSPRAYEMLDRLDKTPKKRTYDVTFKPHGSGELEAMERRIARISSGNVQGLRRQYGGGSLDLLRDALSGAGSLLIRADLDIANLPEVLAEARQAGVSIGGGFAAGIEKDRKALARLVAQSNALISRIENLRSLTDQLARAQSRARGAKGDEKKQAQAEVARIRKQIEAAMKAYRQIAGNRSAPDAIADLNRRITAQIRKLNKPARELRDKAEEFRQAKEDFVEAFKSAALEQFDRETTAQLNGIAASFQNGFERIGNTFRLIPGEFRKLDDRTEAAMDALQATLDSQLKGIDAKYKAAGKDLDARARELTAAEKRLAQIRDEQSASDIARNVQEAEAALREAYAKGMPASEIKQRQRAVEEARRAELIAGLEKTAEAERAAKDAQVEAERERLAELEAAERESAQRRFETAQKRLQDTAEAERLYLEAMLAERQESLELQRNAERVALEQSLNAWGNAFMRQQAIVGGNHASVLAQVKSFSDKLRTSGSRLGKSYAQGLRESFPAIRRAASDAADIISRYLKLHSPAKEGPLSDLDRWWGPFGRTLVSGADMGMADALVRAYSNPELGGAAGPVGMSGPVVVNVTVVDQTFAGMSRDQARRVAQDIKPELDRIVSVGVR